MKSVLLKDGRRLTYREAGTGPSLVLLHGWAMSSAVFAEVLQGLGRTFRVLAPDLPGHGGSDPSPDLTLSSLAEDLRIWSEGLGLDDFALGGWSMGGQAALALAGALSSRVRRLLLVSTTPRFVAGEDWGSGLPAGEVRAMARSVRQDCPRALERFFHRQFEEDELTRDRLREIVRFALRPHPLPGALTALAGLDILRQSDLRPGLAAIDIPALVVHGERDRIIPSEAGRFLASRLPRAGYRELSGTGHAPFLSRPEIFLDLCRNFLHP